MASSGHSPLSSPPTAGAGADAKRISVVIPSYRSASVVGDAIQSVLGQTRQPDEIIVVNDGSPPGDDTAAVCRQFGDQVTYIRQANGGAAAARNAGIAASRGDWLAFLDADDLWEPDKLELQCGALAAQPDADFAMTAALVWSPASRQYLLSRWTGSLDPDVMRAELLVRNIFTGLCSSLLIRRTALEAVGGFAAGKAAEDRRLALELLGRFRAVLLPQPMIRQKPGPAHWTDPERHRREMLLLIEDYSVLYQQLDPTGRLQRRALAKTHDRAGMHYLENRQFTPALRDLMRAACLWPALRNPWRMMLNACAGRLW